MIDGGREGGGEAGTDRVPTVSLPSRSVFSVDLLGQAQSPRAINRSRTSFGSLTKYNACLFVFKKKKTRSMVC